MRKILLLFLLGMLLASQINAQKSKRKSKFKALLPAFEPSKPKRNSIAEKPKKTVSASSPSTAAAGGNVNTGKAAAPQPVDGPKDYIVPDTSKYIQQPREMVIPAVNPDRVATNNVKATPYSLLVPEKPAKKPSKPHVHQHRPKKSKFTTMKRKPSWSNVPSKPKSKPANFFSLRPTTTPKPTTPAPPPPPAQQSLFNFFNGQNFPSPAQQAMPFPLPSMPPYPGLPNNNPQLNNVYKMIATWLVSHAMQGGNTGVPNVPRPTITTPAPMQFSAKRPKQQKKQPRKNTLTRPPQQGRRPNKNRKHARSQKKAKKQNKNAKQEAEALRRMRQKAYEEYMDEVYDIDVPEKPLNFGNGVPPYHQGPPFGFPW
jgi:hypothetical protein